MLEFDAASSTATRGDAPPLPAWSPAAARQRHTRSLRTLCSSASASLHHAARWSHLHTATSPVCPPCRARSVTVVHIREDASSRPETPGRWRHVASSGATAATALLAARSSVDESDCHHQVRRRHSADGHAAPWALNRASSRHAATPCDPPIQGLVVASVTPHAILHHADPRPLDTRPVVQAEARHGACAPCVHDCAVAGDRREDERAHRPGARIVWPLM